MGLIHDDVIPSHGGRRSLRSLSAAVVAALVLAIAVAGLTSMMRPGADPEPAPALEEPALDLAEEVLGEVFTRDDDDDDDDEAPVSTATTQPPTTEPPTTNERPTTTATRPTTTTTTTERPIHAPPPVDLTLLVDGNVVVEQFFSPRGEEENRPNDDCETLREQYEVVVYDEDRNVIGIAELTGGTYEREEEPWGGTTTRCTFEYSVRVPETESGTYNFTLAEAQNHATVHDSEAVTEDELRSDGGPTLSVNRRYCPEC